MIRIPQIQIPPSLLDKKLLKRGVEALYTTFSWKEFKEKVAASYFLDLNPWQEISPFCAAISGSLSLELLPYWQMIREKIVVYIIKKSMRYIRWSLLL